MADDQSEQAELEALIEEARQRARRRRIGYAAIGLVAATLVGALLLIVSGGDEGDNGAGSTAAAGATPSQELLMLRVNTTPRLVEIDPASGRSERLPIVLPCGDTPYCLIAAGDQLVISGVGRTTVLEPGQQVRPADVRIGRGWITVPAQEPGTVWLGILDRDQRPSAAITEYRQVDLNGDTLRVVPAPDGEWAWASVNAGLLYSGSNLRLWSFAERRFTLQIPGRIPIDSSGNLVASCDYPCQTLSLTNTATGTTTRIHPPRGYGWTGGSEGAFSPDGTLLAVPVAKEPGEVRSHDDAVAIVDVPTGTVRRVPGSRDLDSAYRAMTWSRDGGGLYFVADHTTIVSFRLGDSRPTELATIQAGRGSILQMVAVGR